MADTLNNLSIIAFALSGVGFILMLFFWFKFRIPTLISDLSGRTAKKSIERMREKYEEEGRARRIGVVRAKEKTERIYNAEGQPLTSAPKSEVYPETSLFGEEAGRTALLDEDNGKTEPLEGQPFSGKNAVPEPVKTERYSAADYEWLTDIMLTDQEDYIPIALK